MKLWVISQTVNNNYDTYDSAVVAAENEDTARQIHPGPWYDSYDEWAPPTDVEVKYIGEAAPGIEQGVIVASFRAG